MRSVEKKLITVLRLALWDKALPIEELPSEQFQQICEIASKQACVGLVCKAFLDSGGEAQQIRCSLSVDDPGKGG